MKNVIYISFFGIVLFSCTKKDIAISNLNGNRIEVMGHAGMGINDVYPINSFESIMNCLSIGADGTEIDVQLTKDSVLVAFHDQTLDGSTTLSGQINDWTFAELKNGTYTNAPYAEYEIISLNEILNSIDYYNYTFTFDIKLNPSQEGVNSYRNRFKNALINLYSDYNLEQIAFIESQSSEFLSLLQNANSAFHLYHYPQSYVEGVYVVSSLGIKGISIDNDLITTEQIQEAHDAGIFVTVWGVNSKNENEEAVNKHPDMIQSDKLDHLVNYLKQ